MPFNSSLTLTEDQATWDAFIASQPFSQFTQSWAWGDFRAAQGQEVCRIILEDEQGIAVAGQFIFHPKHLLGGFWYAPRGPVIRRGLEARSTELLQEFFAALPSLLETPAFFIRCEPPIEVNSQAISLPAHFLRSHSYQPASTVVIDLMQSEETLLAAMHEKTRYNIRLAERKGVTVRLSASERDVAAFLRLNSETVERDLFVSQSADYIQKTYDFLRPLGMAAIRIAEFEGRALAANMEIRFGDTVTYLYGASSSSDRNLMAPFALHWSAIKEAKADGYRLYDMYGVNPTDHASSYFKPSWEGITRFKLGWGGRRIDFIGTWELPARKFLYRIARAFQGVMSR
ncbi:MAG: peptidoglycan bridge formation glycyltransferase FemA/FemB family protein [Patescibacteria group bacterium]